MEHQDAYKQAKERVEAKIGFYFHLLVYIVISGLLVYINMSTSPHYLWAKWPIIGWGIGVFFHALALYVYGGGIIERMIDKEMKKGSTGVN